MRQLLIQFENYAWGPLVHLVARFILNPRCGESKLLPVFKSMSEALKLIDEAGRLGIHNLSDEPRTLNQMIGDGLPVELELRVILEALGVLASVHTNVAMRPDARFYGAIHPDNIQATPSGDVVLQPCEAGQLSERSGNYLAPEQEQAMHVDQQADIYALGLILFECLTGSRVAPQDKPHVANSILAGTVSLRDPEWSTRPLLEVAARAIAHSPSERWSSAREFAAELESHAQFGLGSKDALAEWILRGKHREPCPSSSTQAISSTYLAFRDEHAGIPPEVSESPAHVCFARSQPAGPIVLRTETSVVVGLSSSPSHERRRIRWVAAAVVTLVLLLIGCYWLGARGVVGPDPRPVPDAQLLDAPGQAAHPVPAEVDFQSVGSLQSSPAKTRVELAKEPQLELAEEPQLELARDPEQPLPTSGEQQVAVETGTPTPASAAEKTLASDPDVAQSEAVGVRSPRVNTPPVVRAKTRAMQKPVAPAPGRKPQPRRSAVYEPEGI